MANEFLITSSSLKEESMVTEPYLSRAGLILACLPRTENFKGWKNLDCLEFIEYA